MTAQLARRVESAAFALAMLAFCAWLHAAISVLGWLARRRPVAPVFAVEAVGVLLVALAVAAVLGRPAYRLLRAALLGLARAGLAMAALTRRQPASPSQRTGGAR